MRRSISITEPKTVLAGQPSNIRFTHIPSNNIPAKSLLKFCMLSKGREIDWEIPEASLKKKQNIIWLELPNGKKVQPKPLEDEFGMLSEFEFILPEEIQASEELSIFIGAPDPTDARNGTKVQQFIQRRKPFLLYIDPKGKGDYKEPETFQIDVRGNILTNIRVVAPSVVSKNQRFDVIIRFEDAFGNLTGFCPDEDTLIELSYDKLRDNLNWKLFVPETGFTTLPNLYFNEPGTYKFKLRNLNTKEEFFSDPIKCFQTTEFFTNWGLLHGESERYDAIENVESALRHFRDDYAFQFYASSPFESEQEISNDEWKQVNTQISDFNENDRFVTFLGFQWSGEVKSEGLRQILYAKDGKQIMRKKDSKSNSLKKIYKAHTPKDFLAIPSFTMHKETGYDFSEFQPEYERVVEIYNAWGSSECTEKEGNERPIKKEGKKFFQEYKDGSIRAALNKNKRFGFVAGGLDDRGIYSDFYQSDQVQYTPGLTAILSAEHTKDQLYQALIQRRTYATTGPRIILYFSLANMPMGSEITTAVKPGLLYNRHIDIFVAGTTNIKKIEIIRSGEVVHTSTHDDYQLDFEYDDSETFEKSALKDPETGELFHYYYARITQEDGHIAWSSPVWVDLKTDVQIKRGRKKTV